MDNKRLIEIKNSKEFVDYMKDYGWHVNHIMNDYHIRKRGISTYTMQHIQGVVIPAVFHQNTCPCKNQQRDSTIDECLILIKKEYRKRKLKKLNSI